MTATAPKPTEIRLAPDKRRLTVRFEDGVAYEFPAEFLRVESPSAEVQGHGPSQRKTVGGKRDVFITAIAPVGNYAVRLTFSDFHDSGIYSWNYFRELGEGQAHLWEAYLAALADKGLARDKPGEA